MTFLQDALNVQKQRDSEDITEDITKQSQEEDAETVKEPRPTTFASQFTKRASKRHCASKRRRVASAKAIQVK